MDGTSGTPIRLHQGMKRRLFNLLATVSLLLALSTAVVWVISYPRYRPNFVDLSWDFPRVGAVSRSGQFTVWVGRLPDEPRPFATEWSVSGLWYRRMAGPNGPVFVAVPHGVLLAALLVPPAVALRRERRLHKRRHLAETTHCPSCGYDLRATPGQCPECGRAVAAPESRPLPPRRVLHRLPPRVHGAPLHVRAVPAG